MIHKIELDWAVDTKGYRLVKDAQFGLCIARNGGSLRPTRPFDGNDAHFLAFAKIENAEQLSDFVNANGLLEGTDSLGRVEIKLKPTPTLDDVLSQEGMLGAEPVRDHLECARFFRKILQAREKSVRTGKVIAVSGLELLPDEPLADISFSNGDNPFELKFVATSLLNGMWLQLANAGQIAQCKQCKSFFSVGVGTGRRADASFCSPEHQIQFNSRKRAKGS